MGLMVHNWRVLCGSGQAGAAALVASMCFSACADSSRVFFITVTFWPRKIRIRQWEGTNSNEKGSPEDKMLMRMERMNGDEKGTHQQGPKTRPLRIVVQFHRLRSHLNKTRSMFIGDEQLKCQNISCTPFHIWKPEESWIRNSWTDVGADYLNCAWIRWNLSRDNAAILCILV